MIGYIVGIDPGQSGGIAWCRMDDGLVSVDKMPATEVDICEALRFPPTQTRAYIEAVGPSRGRNADGSSRVQGVVSAFKFGESYGLLRGILVAFGIPLHEVRPQVWQRAHGLIKQGAKLTQVERKNRNKALAQQWWPHIKITHATADALLIMQYGIKELAQAGTVARQHEMIGREPF